MRTGSLVKHRVISLGVGIVTSVHRPDEKWRHSGRSRAGPGDRMVYVLWTKHKSLVPNLEIPESLEVISEGR